MEKDKGSSGEYETSISLEKIKGKKYFVFNAYIPKAGGKGCVETDIIMIHEKGVVVIENKNYSGVVKGKADRTYWEQILNGRRYTFYSPVYQNMNHIRHIKDFLENRGAASPSLPVFSAVVFNDKIRRLKIKRKWKSEAVICRSRKAPAKIQKKLRHGERALDEREMEELYRELKSRSEVFRWVKRSHRKKVEKYKKNLD